MLWLILLTIIHPKFGENQFFHTICVCALNQTNSIFRGPNGRGKNESLN